MGKHKLLLFGKKELEQFKELKWKKKVINRDNKNEIYITEVWLPWQIERKMKEDPKNLTAYIK